MNSRSILDFVDNGNGGAVFYSGHPNEVNNVRISFTAAGIVFDDQVPIQTLDSECRISSAGDATCPGSASSIQVDGRDRDDTIRYTAPHRGFVTGGSGAGTILGGLRQAGFGRAIEPVVYEGKERNDIEVIEGSNFNDTLLGTGRNETFRGLNGNDVIDTGGGSDVIDEGSAPNVADTLVGSSLANQIDGRGGPDTILGQEGNDVIFAQDGFEDVVGCGSGIDTAQLVSRDGFGGCESATVTPVGRLRLTQAGTPVGAIVIRPGAERIVAHGAVELMRKHARLTSKGRKVSARLALRLDRSLAGATLSADVQATDTRGRRQLERDAGMILVVR